MKKLGAIILFTLGATISVAAQTSTAIDAGDSAGITKLKFATVLVRDYDEALKWYTEVLGFQKLQDQQFGPHRWIVVAPREQKEIGIVLAVSRKLTPDDKTTDYMDRLGKETNWVYQARDVRRLYEQLSKRGVKFLQLPTDQPWGTVQAVFEDLYGNIFVVEGPQQRPTTAEPNTKASDKSPQPNLNESRVQSGDEDFRFRSTAFRRNV